MKMSRFKKNIVAYIFSVALLFAFIFSLAIPAAKAFADTSDSNKPNNIKVLMVGNSFGVDAAEHLNAILQAAGVQSTVGVLYYSSCSINTHWTNAQNDNAVYTYYKNSGEGWNQNMGVWSMNGTSKMSEVLADEKWDVITLQQASGSSGEADSYNSDIDNLVEYIKTRVPDAKLGWHMTWAYQQNSSHTDFAKYDYDQTKMYKAITDAVQTKILTNKAFEFVVPSGTTIQNMRTSRIGDTMTIDGYHLSRPLGRYAAALTFAKTLVPEFDLSGDVLPASVNGVQEKDWIILQEAVLGAINNPFSVTYSTNIDREQYELFDWTAVSGFWTRYDGCDFAFLTTPSFQGYEEMAKKYVTCDVQLTEDVLPKGSIIEIGEGYQLTPVGWNADGVQSTDLSINTVTGATTISVGDNWWNNCKHRVFNINAATYGDLSESLSDVKEAIKIYVPIKEEININFDDYIQIDWAPVDNAYWFSTDSANHSVLNTPSNSAYTNFGLYVSSRGMFTRENLPIGSVIVVEQGYQYRPEGWKELGQNSVREGNVSTNIVVIDEDWWGDYQYRAFNVSSRAGEDLVGKIDKVKENFRIYVPKDAEYSTTLYYPEGSAGNEKMSAKHITLIVMVSVCGGLVVIAGATVLGIKLTKKRKETLSEKSV